MRAIIVDGRNMAYRSYYAFKELATSYGRPTAVTYGSALALNGLIAEYKPDYMIVVDDSPGETFRHRLYPEYKGQRSSEGLEGFHGQLPDLYRLIDAYGIKLLRHHGVEADDLIGSLMQFFANEEVLIVSNDKDFMQLVDDRVKILRPVRGGGFEVVGSEGVMKKFGCRPDQVIDVLALMGDTSDNVPGVFGIGEVGASKLVKSFGSLEAIYRSLGVIAPKLGTKLQLGKSMAFLSKELVTIKRDIQLGLDIRACRIEPQALERPELLALFHEWEFKSFFEPDSVAPGKVGQ